MPLPLPLPILLLVTFSFFPSLIILTIFFSSIIAERNPRKKKLYHNYGLVTAFSGAAIGAAFCLASPVIPGSIPFMDVAVILAVITWGALLRYYCKTSWLETLFPVILAAILYTVILAMASAFSLLIIS